MSNLKPLSLLQQIASENKSQLKLNGTPEELDVMRYACREFFICFCVAVMPSFQATRFHVMMADKLEKAYRRVKNGENVRLIIEAPPQHGKSTVVSELFAAWIMGKEGWPLIGASYGATLAEKKSKNTRAIVMSDTYRYIFPEAKLSSDSTSKEFWANRIGASYKAAGRGAGLTGTPGKVMIADDLIADKEEANSQLVRENAFDWWTTVFYTRKQKVSLIVLVETRWHLDDPAGKLEEQMRGAIDSGLPEGTYDVWEKLTFPAIAEEDEYIDGKLFRKKGEALAPERFPLSELVKTKNTYIQSGRIGDWASLYQQSPIINENAKFRKSYFRYYDPATLVDRRVYYITVVDLAISQKKSADHTVVRTIAKESDGSRWFLCDETAGIMDPLQTIDAIFMHYEKYRSEVHIESVGYQASLKWFMIEEQKKRQTYFNIEDIKQSTITKKHERIEGLLPLYKAGLIYHRNTGEDEALEIELMQHPKGRRDDRADALSMGLSIVRNSPTPQRATQGSVTSYRKTSAGAAFSPHDPFSSV